MAYYLVNTGMSLATICFIIGYFYRFKPIVHRRYMVSGVILVVMSALALVGSIYILHDGNRIAAGFINIAPEYIIVSHRILAVFSVVFMGLMVKTGLNRDRKQHIFFSRFFMISYIIVYISGLFIFQTN